MRKRHLYKTLVLLLSIIFLSACDLNDIVDSPPKLIKITKGPSENEISKQNNVSFSWEGSFDNQLFEYRLSVIDKDDFFSTYFDWTSKTSNKSVLFRNLPEGIYKFEIKTYRNDINETLHRIFTIDALKAPALFFYEPSKPSITGDSVSLIIAGDGLQKITKFNFTLLYNKNYLSIEEVSVINKTILENVFLLQEEERENNLYEYTETPNGKIFKLIFSELDEYYPKLLKITLKLIKEGKTQLLIYEPVGSNQKDEDILFNISQPVTISILKK